MNNNFYVEMMSDVGMMSGTYILATITLLITASLIALVYMVSKVINDRKLQVWVKNEVLQCFATATLLFLAVGLFSLTSDLIVGFLSSVATASGMEVPKFISSNSQSGNNVEPHMIFANGYLLSRLDRLSDMYDFLFYTYAFASSVGATGAFFPEQGLITIGLGFLGTVANFIQPILEYIYYGFLFVYFQLGLLELITKYFFYAFPAGIMLRSFPFSRSLGSFLIATAIGLYFVYPIILSLLLLTNYKDDLQIDENTIVSLVKNEYPSQFLVYYIQQKLAHEEVAGDSGSTTSKIESTLSKVKNKISWISSLVQFLLLTMILYPLIAIIATYTFIHQFAALMEANVADLGRGLVKLI